MKKPDQNNVNGLSIKSRREDKGKETLKKFDEMSNKLYRSAAIIDINSRIVISKNYDLKFTKIVSNIKESLNYMEKINRSENNLNYYHEYRYKIVDTYLNDNLISKRSIWEKLKRILTELSKDNFIDKEQYSKLIKNSEGIDYNLMSFLEKYKYDIIKRMKFKVLESETKFKEKLFSGFPITTFENISLNLPDSKTNLKRNEKENIDKYMKPTKNILMKSDNISIKDSFKKVSQNLGYDLNEFPQDYARKNTYNNSVSNKIHLFEEKFCKNIMIEEFRKAVNSPEMNDELCINYLSICNYNLIDTVDLFFQIKYNTKKLKIIYIIEDKTEFAREFAFTSNSGDLYIPIYSNPNINNAELFYKSKKLEINPLTQKFIGHLNLANNSRLYVVVNK